MKTVYAALITMFGVFALIACKYAFTINTIYNNNNAVISSFFKQKKQKGEQNENNENGRQLHKNTAEK